MTLVFQSCYLLGFSWKRNLGLGAILLRLLSLRACKAGWWASQESWPAQLNRNKVWETGSNDHSLSASDSFNSSYQQFTSDNNSGDKISLKGWLKGGRTKVFIGLLSSVY